MMKTYYLLTKPGIIIGNAVTAAGAFILGSRGNFDYLLFLITVVGLFFVIASACVFNNCIDREADAKMMRTKTRALPKGEISIRSALFFAVGLGLVGGAILIFGTNWIAAFVASMGFFIYVVLYSFWKYRTAYATLVGSISGAVPPVVGYCSASGCFDMGAALLLIVLVLWQMPHFFSIAIFRKDEYAAAAIPVFPVAKGIFATKIQTALYILAFIGAEAMLFVCGYTGYAYLYVVGFLSLAWLWLSIRGFQCVSDGLWARQMFRLSLVVITAFSILIAL